MSPTEFRALRNALGLTVRALAAQIDVAPSTIFRWETGRRKIPGSVALLLRRMAGDKAGASHVSHVIR